jgi:hypothetical protein
MEARVLMCLVAPGAGFFLSQECGGSALTGCGRVDYRSVIWRFFGGDAQMTER